MNDLKAPKLFISYSWTTPDHEEWVLNLATELRDSGVDVILDKWDLKEGQDANAFMERMVTDKGVNKVLLVCDKTYTEKADGRKGGVGKETQIISAEIYDRVEQSKFVAIIAEKDENGKPFLPAYYKSRIYIDLSDDDLYPKNFEQLLHWIYDKPLHVKPEIGKPPTFLDEGASISLGTGMLFRRVIDAVRNSKSYAYGALREYFNTFGENLARFRLDPSAGDNEFDEKVIENIENFTPYRNEAIQVFIALSQYDQSSNPAQYLHRFFETIIPYLNRPEDVQSGHEWDFDNFKFIIQELFLYCIAILLKYERFENVAHLTQQHYYVENDPYYGRQIMRDFGVFQNNLQTLEHRNKRKNLGQLSLHADLLKKRCKGIRISFNDLLQADFVLCLADCVQMLRDKTYRSWWPETLVYKLRARNPFELFVRSQSKAYFDRFKICLGITDKKELETVVEAFTTGQLAVLEWPLARAISPTHLMGFEALCTKD